MSTLPLYPSQARATDDCLPAYLVRDEKLAPLFLPGDVLMPVTCNTRQPRFGEYVLVKGPAAEYEVLRYIGAVGSGRNQLLTWDGHRYRRLPQASLSGRILSVRRQLRTFDLSVTSGWPGRDPALALAHRLLEGVLRWLPSGRRSLR